MQKMLATLLVAATFWLPVADAVDPCTNNGGLIDHTTVALGTDDGTARFYVDVRELNGDFAIINVWIYQESNGIDGLQRGGAAWRDPTNTDPCSDPLPPGARPDTVWP